jgi:hypothetical protein
MHTWENRVTELFHPGFENPIVCNSMVALSSHGYFILPVANGIASAADGICMPIYFAIAELLN